MSTRAERDVLRRRLPANEGIYVLYEKGEPKYVGRSDKLADRLLSHGRPSSGSESATFAINLARAECASFATMSRQDLHRDEEFRRRFDSAKERVRRMEVCVVGLANPLRADDLRCLCSHEAGHTLQQLRESLRFAAPTVAIDLMEDTAGRTRGPLGSWVCPLCRATRPRTSGRRCRRSGP